MENNHKKLTPARQLIVTDPLPSTSLPTTDVPTPDIDVPSALRSRARTWSPGVPRTAPKASAKKPDLGWSKPEPEPVDPLEPEIDFLWADELDPDCQPGMDERSDRIDGWTLAKQRRFCEIIAETGIVSQACREVGMSRQSAYVFRESTRGRAFAEMWDESRARALRAVVDDAVEQALSGKTSFDVDAVSWETVRERNVRSPRKLLTMIERLRSERLLGEARTMAASRNFQKCLDLLLLGQVYHDKQHPYMPIPILPPQSEEHKVNPNPSLYYRRWTPAHQRKFCMALIQHGNVDRACAYAGRSRTGAYILRNRAEGKAFALAWDAALLVVSKQMMDDAIEMAREGGTTELIRKGKPNHWRKHFSPALAMEVEARLNKLKAHEDKLYGGGYARMGCEADHGKALEWLESGEALRVIEAVEGG
jgi:hypothetical protein